MLTNYHHKILNEPDKNYSFYHDKIGISIVVLYFTVVLIFSIFPLSSPNNNIYGMSLGEGGFCYTLFSLIPLGKNKNKFVTL